MNNLRAACLFIAFTFPKLSEKEEAYIIDAREILPIEFAAQFSRCEDPTASRISEKTLIYSILLFVTNCSVN